MSDTTYSVKRCLKCGEFMPLYEKVCYCTGPIIIEKVGADKKRLSDYYGNRKFMDRLRRGG